MSRADISKVLSSGSRWQILTALSRGPRDVRDIVKEVSIQPTAVRYHIQSLLGLGLVESYEEKRGVGRPRILYRLAKKQVTVGFPPRHYILLSEIFLSSLQELHDLELVKTALNKVSRDMGKSMMNELTTRFRVLRWTPSKFEEYFVKVLLPEYGSQSETVELGDRMIVFRSYTCPFQELALKYPEVVCDLVHDPLITGFCEAVNLRIKTQRVKCMGQGDDYCEFSFNWPGSSQA